MELIRGYMATRNVTRAAVSHLISIIRIQLEEHFNGMYLWVYGQELRATQDGITAPYPRCANQATYN